MDAYSVFQYFTIILIAYFITGIEKIISSKQLKDKMTPVVVTKIRKIMGIIIMIIGFGIASKTFISDTAIEKVKNKVEKVIDKVK